MATMRPFRDNDHWVEYVRTLYRVSLIHDLLVEEADTLGNRDRRYVLRQVTRLKRYRLAVLQGMVPAERDTCWREWNVLADLALAARHQELTLGEYLEDDTHALDVFEGMRTDTMH